MMLALWRVIILQWVVWVAAERCFPMDTRRWSQSCFSYKNCWNPCVCWHVAAEIFASPWMFLFIRWNIMKPHSGQNIQWLCVWVCVRLQSFRLPMEIYEEWCGDVLWNLCYELVRSWWKNYFLHRDVRVDSCCSNDGQAWLKPVFPALILQA